MKKLLAFSLFFAPLCFGQGFSTGSITAQGTTCATTNACVILNLPSNTAGVVVTVSGTYIGTLQLEATNDGTNYVNLDQPALAVSSAATNVVGTWSFAVIGMAQVRVRASAYTSGTATVTMTIGGGSVPIGPTTFDPCGSFAAKQSVVINITTATTTQLVALSGSQTIYVCGFAMTMSSTVAPNTIQFEYGTGASCGTGTTVLTGTLNAAGSLTYSQDYGAGAQTIFKTAAGNAFCALTTVGTGPSIQGVVTYVIQ